MISDFFDDSVRSHGLSEGDYSERTAGRTDSVRSLNNLVDKGEAMRIRTEPAFVLGAAALAVTFFAMGCRRNDRAAAKHPESFEAAKALSHERRAPILVDFYSPT
jgi:hypothetical protein